jgi:hypothetical protein
VSDARRLAVWALATFHATLFVLVLVIIAYRGGGLGSLLASLNTLVGLGLFVALWCTTVVATARALRGADPLDARLDRARFARMALRAGSGNALAFLAVLGIVLIVGTIAATPEGPAHFSVLGTAVFIAPFAVAVAAVLGGIVGVVLAAIDLAMLGLAQRLVR